MHRKLITACMALAAIAALALPAAASAAPNEPLLVDPSGTVPIGALIVGTPIGDTVFTDTSTAPLVTCSGTETTKLTGKVLKNSGGTIEGEITTRDFAGTGTQAPGEPEPECTGSFGNVSVTVPNNLIIKSTPLMATHEFQVTNVGSTKVKFILKSTTIGECEYESLNPVKGDLTTSATTSALTVRNTAAGSGSKLIRQTGFLCPTSGMLKMTFHLETEDKTSIGVVDTKP